MELIIILLFSLALIILLIISKIDKARSQREMDAEIARLEKLKLEQKLDQINLERKVGLRTR